VGVENPKAIDLAGLERDGSAIVLTIADGLGWVDEHGHLVGLQRKLDAYLAFIESGQVFDVYPEATGRRVVIDVVTGVPMAPAGVELLRLAAAVARELGVTVKHRVIPVATIERDGLN
jgi:hypothetical protein